MVIQFPLCCRFTAVKFPIWYKTKIAPMSHCERTAKFVLPPAILATIFSITKFWEIEVRERSDGLMECLSGARAIFLPVKPIISI